MSGYFLTNREISDINVNEIFIENNKIKFHGKIIYEGYGVYEFDIYDFSVIPSDEFKHVHVVNKNKILYGDDFLHDNEFIEYHACVHNHLYVLKWIFKWDKSIMGYGHVVKGFIECIKLKHYEIIAFLIQKCNIIRACYLERRNINQSENLKVLKGLKYKRKNAYFKGYKKN